MKDTVDSRAVKIVELMGDLPRIELFAREAAPGWDAWGDEAPNTTDAGAGTEETDGTDNAISNNTGKQAEAPVA